MTDRKKALTDLLEKVEAGGDVYGFGGLGTPLLRGYAESACNGSLDSAKALHEAVLPGWILTYLGQYPYDWKAAVFKEPYGPRKEHTCAGNPARAWLIAILKALIAKEDA
ncbi:MAG: hypothetical protein RI571_15855 [Roseovarius sp.]|nr:hypothetical protein [Roseovarius sp.]